MTLEDYDDKAGLRRYVPFDKFTFTRPSETPPWGDCGNPSPACNCRFCGDNLAMMLIVILGAVSV